MLQADMLNLYVSGEVTSQADDFPANMLNL